ncbi:VOC family protein [Limnobaculum zhutongyuii]|uniref:VOC family protein n=1 Tax=Limnobaculum zhutongyuii TaxID=2498113 RepID=A0A411WJI2_9GAMM|nr:VOC family protein [Limnobaculum zhutongyuii]QBH96342.1 VOC family protein [Limnobaculum zhutongyuii]TQS87069.1 VOC family protein [Limnobaculum zhutongyuii]
MKYNPTVWFKIYVSDMERAVSFYQSLLDIELTKLSDTDTEYFMFPYQEGIEGSGGALVKSNEGTPGSTGPRIYLACSDCAIQVSKVEAIGGRVISPKQSIGEFGFCATIEDTEGNVIGLHSMQ